MCDARSSEGPLCMRLPILFAVAILCPINSKDALHHCAVEHEAGILNLKRTQVKPKPITVTPRSPKISRLHRGGLGGLHTTTHDTPERLP